MYSRYILPFVGTSLLKSVCFCLEVSLPFSDVEMSLRTSPGFVQCVEFISKVDSESDSSLGASTLFCSDEEDYEISSVRSLWKWAVMNFLGG